MYLYRIYEQATLYRVGLKIIFVRKVLLPVSKETQANQICLPKIMLRYTFRK